MIKKLFSILSLCGCLLGATSCQYTTKTVSTGRDLAIADSMFTHILDKYNVEKYGLLQETYPANPDNQVTYLAEGAEQKRNQEVSFLWPYSGMNCTLQDNRRQEISESAGRKDSAGAGTILG